MGTKKYAKTDGRAVQMKHYSWERKKKLNSGEKKSNSTIAGQRELDYIIHDIQFAQPH